jgi:hypothetical protein
LAKARLPGKDDLLLSVEPRGEKSLSPAGCIEQGRDVPCRSLFRGSGKILTYKERRGGSKG